MTKNIFIFLFHLQNLKNFLDGATNGFVYMSLGTNVKSKLLPKRILQMFTSVFATLPYRVLWKFEDDNLAVPPNVFISTWIPQQGVLGKLRETREVARTSASIL